MSNFIKLTMKSTGLPLVINASLIETMIPLDGYTSIRTSGMPFGEADHVLESVEQIEDQLLRDEFAMAALNGFVNEGAIPIDTATELSYFAADAMLKERLK